ncbi:MAG: hypothetical protein E7663_01775 [Ruminococcaceae bacterium]|nr:hypothetical protein [Oscillospiraceae bacterium]
MSKKNQKGTTTPLMWTIRILVIVIFLVSLGITVSRVVEFSEKQKQKEELEQSVAFLPVADGIER